MRSIQTRNTINLMPQSYAEAERLAKLLSESTLVPDAYKRKPNDVLIAMQMGAEVGLPPIQALQNIAVINGRPCMWGDALIALVKHHPDFEDIDEKIENDVAICTIKRRGQTAQRREFSMEDARAAGLTNRPTWKTYPKRMLQMRARGFCIRDTFPDALKGLFVREEVQDYDDYRVVKNEDATKAAEVLQKLDIEKSTSAQTIDDELPGFPGISEFGYETFIEKISKYNVDPARVESWLKKGNVQTLEDLSDETKKAIIDKLDSETSFI